MRLNKKLFYNFHTWIGLKLSILFFIVCFSGTMATLSYELDWLFNKEIRATPVNKMASKNVIRDNIKEKYPNGKIGYWERPEVPYICDIVQVRQDKTRTFVFANPYTGEVQGDAKLTFKRFFRDLHYYLFIPNQVGHFLVLFFGFFLFLSLGTALLFYKKWWKKLFVLQTGKGPLVFFRSFHKLIGLWSIPFSILFSVTGIWYFLERANLANIGGTVNPRSPKVAIDSTYEDYNFGYGTDYDKVVRIVEQTAPNMKVESLSPGSAKGNTIYVRGKSDVPLVRQRANRVYINPVTYEVVKVQNAKDISTTMWINDIADPLHFGYWGGLPTKIIWFIFGLGISSLVLSGIWTALKKKAMSRHKKKQKLMGVWKYINWSIFALIIYFCFGKLHKQYHIAIQTQLLIGLVALLALLLAYYVFDYRLRRSVDQQIKLSRRSED